MTTETISSTGDRASAAAWEAAIGANPSVEQIGEVSEAAFDAGEVTINVSNTSAVLIKLTVPVGSNWRYDEVSGWPNAVAARKNCAHIASSLGTPTCVTIETDNVTIDGLSLVVQAAGDGVKLNGATADWQVSNCIITSNFDGGAVDGIRRNGSVAIGAETGLVYNVACGGMKEAFRFVDQDVTILNCCAASMVHTQYQDSGIWAQQTNRANTVTAKNCVMIEQFVDYKTSGGGTLNTTNCASSDATGDTGLINQSHAEVFKNPWVGEVDFTLNTDQQFPDVAFSGHTFEGGLLHPDFSGNGTGFSVQTAAAFRGTYGLQLDITSTTFRDLISPDYSDAAGWGTDWYRMFCIRLRTGFTMGTGENFLNLDFRDNTTTRIRFSIRESGGNFQLRMRDQMKSLNGTDQTMTVGTWYKVRVHVNHIVSGIREWWFQPADGTAWGASKDTNNTNYTTHGAPSNLRWLGSGIDAGTSGKVDYDIVLVGTSNVLDEYVSGVGGHGDDLTGNATYQGSDESGTFTTDYEQRTRSDWYIGVDEIPAAGGGGTTIPAVDEGMLVGGFMPLAGGLA